MNHKGADDGGRQFDSIGEIWKEKETSEWYSTAKDYWQNIPTTVNGVLGGYGNLSKVDAESSLSLLTRLNNEFGLETGSVLDCGAGIGRVSKDVLLHRFDNVDLLEPAERLITEAKKLIPECKNFYCEGMETFEPEKEKYDCIWIQWAISQLTDEDVVGFLRRCEFGLKKTSRSFVVVKENVAGRLFYVDTEDSSITRTKKHFKQLFEQSGAKVVFFEIQPNWPKELFKVKTFVLEYKK